MRYLALMLVALGTASAASAQLMIAPTTIAVQPERHSAVVTVENVSDRPVDVQVRGYDWTQPDGRDALAPAEDMVVSPAIASVPPRGKQVFRILFATPSTGRERAWRLRFNQLPRDDGAAVAVNLEFLVLVFRGPVGGAPRLAWNWTADGRIAVTNVGDRRTRLARLALTDADRPAVEVTGAASAYLLSGATRVFAPAAPAPARARLIATGDTGPLDAMPAALAAR